MTTTNQNIYMYAGETKHVIVTVTSADPINLMNTTIKWAVYNSFNSNVLLYKDTSNGITVTDPSGEFMIQINDADLINAGSFPHVAKIIDGQNETSVLFTGLINVQATAQSF